MFFQEVFSGQSVEIINTNVLQKNIKFMKKVN